MEWICDKAVFIYGKINKTLGFSDVYPKELHSFCMLICSIILYKADKNWFLKRNYYYGKEKLCFKFYRIDPYV